MVGGVRGRLSLCYDVCVQLDKTRVICIITGCVIRQASPASNLGDVVFSARQRGRHLIRTVKRETAGRAEAPGGGSSLFLRTSLCHPRVKNGTRLF